MESMVCRHNPALLSSETRVHPLHAINGPCLGVEVE
jgi:hypothetical protein